MLRIFFEKNNTICSALKKAIQLLKCKKIEFPEIPFGIYKLILILVCRWSANLTEVLPCREGVFTVVTVW